MQSVREIYKIGKGPSSSHTMGPDRAARLFRAETPTADRYVVKLRGSLAKTGKGHGTDTVLQQAFVPIVPEIVFDFDTPISELPHPNTMYLIAYRNNSELARMEVMSIGGGDIRITGRSQAEAPQVYAEESFSQIADICKHRGIRLSDYVYEHEDADFHAYLDQVWAVMNSSIDQGLTTSGILPGGLQVERKAQYLYNQRHMDESRETRENRIVCAYAFAASEQNADNGIIVTAPTCGACSVLPASLRYMREKKGLPQELVQRALAVAGLIGNLVKRNASISGAQCGCQAEIGTACAMAAAALGELFEMGIDQIEYAAEVALEHHLGLTCDPICGLVQIPCIERNAVAAMRAINAVSLANFLSGSRKISFDLIVKTMYETGIDLSAHYRETAEGGLAKLYI